MGWFPNIKLFRFRTTGSTKIEWLCFLEWAQPLSSQGSDNICPRLIVLLVLTQFTLRTLSVTWKDGCAPIIGQLALRDCALTLTHHGGCCWNHRNSICDQLVCTLLSEGRDVPVTKEHFPSSEILSLNSKMSDSLPNYGKWEYPFSSLPKYWKLPEKVWKYGINSASTTEIRWLLRRGRVRWMNYQIEPLIFLEEWTCCHQTWILTRTMNAKSPDIRSAVNEASTQFVDLLLGLMPRKVMFLFCLPTHIRVSLWCES